MLAHAQLGAHANREVEVAVRLRLRVRGGDAHASGGAHDVHGVIVRVGIVRLVLGIAAAGRRRARRGRRGEGRDIVGCDARREGRAGYVARLRQAVRLGRDGRRATVARRGLRRVTRRRPRARFRGEHRSRGQPTSEPTPTSAGPTISRDDNNEPTRRPRTNADPRGSAVATLAGEHTPTSDLPKGRATRTARSRVPRSGAFSRGKPEETTRLGARPCEESALMRRWVKLCLTAGPTSWQNLARGPSRRGVPFARCSPLPSPQRRSHALHRRYFRYIPRAERHSPRV